MAGSIAASASKQLGQYASRPRDKAYCYAELAVLKGSDVPSVRCLLVVEEG